MINCPNCGYSFTEELKDGITVCQNCNKTIDSSLKNQLLAAGWLIRKETPNMQVLKYRTKLSEEALILAFAFVNDNCYSHDEFLEALNKLGID